MAIVMTLDVNLARRKLTSRELARRIGMTEANMSLFKTGKFKGVKFSTINAICRELGCQPGDLMTYVPDPQPTEIPEAAPDADSDVDDNTADR
jgi:putative transcriptional regulator